jgi:hypothetical protein
MPAWAPGAAVRTVAVRVAPDDGWFTYNHRRIEVRGHQVCSSDGTPLEHSEVSAVAEGAFCFRTALVADALDGRRLSAVVLRRPRDRCGRDPVAILRLDDDTVIGHVPMLLVEAGFPLSSGIDEHAQDVQGATGIVTKTFLSSGAVVAGEVLVPAPGYELRLA